MHMNPMIEMASPHVVHMTSAHPRDDTRIFLKMCRSAAAGGNRVTLLVADGLGNSSRDGIEIIDVGGASGRLGRMLGSASRVYRKAVALDADIYHFHDPELLPWGAILQSRGKQVIYDAHEDLGEDVRTKAYIPAPLRRLVAAGSDAMEKLFSSRLSGVVGATPVIAAKFTGYGLSSTEVNNFPIMEELHVPDAATMTDRPREFVYVGYISVDRGLVPMLEAVQRLPDPDAVITIAGSFSVEEEQRMAEAMPGWRRVRFLGMQDRGQVAELMARARAGLVLFQPLPNNVAGRPNKLFEYMSAGIPVIASDYPGWRAIVDGARCGLLVDPQSPGAIADAMQWILDHPDEAEAMGRRGYEAIRDRYSWDHEAEKLMALYSKLGANVAEARA